MTNDALRGRLVEYETYRKEVRMFDVWAVVACLLAWIGASLVVSADQSTNGLVLWLGRGLCVAGLLIFLRSWGSLGEKFKILAACADEIAQESKVNQLFRHDRGLLKSRRRQIADYSLFGFSMVVALFVPIASFF